MSFSQVHDGYEPARKEILSPKSATASSAEPSVAGKASSICHSKKVPLMSSQTAFLALALAGCDVEQTQEKSRLPQDSHEHHTEGSQVPQVNTIENTLTIAQMNPPPPPLVLPVGLQPNNAPQFRISQRGNDFPTHSNNSTRHAIDISQEGLAYSPLAGLVHRVPGDCQPHNPAEEEVCPVVCSSQWGNHVLLDGVDGDTYLFAHCRDFNNAAPDNAFIGKGTPVCTIGCTGNATAVHLHFDKIRRNGNAYISQGVPQFLTFEVGSSEPSIENANTFETCCNGGVCDAQSGDADCKNYLSFNRSNLDVVSSFARFLRANDNRVAAVRGGFTLDQTVRNPLGSLYYQEGDVHIQGRVQRTMLAFVVGSPENTGSRNPFITTGYSYYLNPTTNQWVFLQRHVDIHAERFINFDLWDYARTYLQGAEREELPFTSRVDSFPDWSANWELHSTTFQINGRWLTCYLAVLKNMRGVRYGILLENNNWTQWTAL